MEININKDYLKSIKSEFIKFLETEKGISWKNERNQKELFLRENFNKASIESMGEGVLRELLNNLWACQIWTNKDYLLEQMLETNDMNTIKNKFKDLLFGTGSLATRFDNVKAIKSMGAASISEILFYHDHQQYPIYNRRAKDGLLKIGIKKEEIPRSMQISGIQYTNYCSKVQHVFKQVKELIPEIKDLFDLDLLLYFISEKETEEEISAQFPIKGEFDHDNTIQDLLQFGDSLGFEVEKEITLSKGCRVDAIWKSRIGNLGQIKYVFEVHKRGSRDSAILNLQRSKSDPAVQKVVIVSTPEELDKIKDEISTLPENFRTSVGYFNVTDLQRAIEYQENIKEILRKLGLTF